MTTGSDFTQLSYKKKLTPKKRKLRTCLIARKSSVKIVKIDYILNGNDVNMP